MQRYVAKVAITPSVFRKSAPKGAMKKAIEFLAVMDLTPLKTLDPSKYAEWLEGETKKLMVQLSREGDLWGPARKAINIFMTMALLDRFMYLEYQLDKLNNELEVPLDGRVRDSLLKWARIKGIPVAVSKSFSINHLKKEDSDKYQVLARDRAREENVPRGLLDVLLWP